MSNAVAPTIPWFAPEVGAAEAAAVLQVLDSGYINDGGVARALERRIAERLGVRHAVAVTSGTAAIAMALLALGIGPGDEVIVPDLTFIATANAVRMTGATVVLADVDPDRFTLDLAATRAAISPRTRAIVPVDVNGRGADYPALETLCREHGLALVCDAAEALGSARFGRPLGTFGQAGCFSFSANKTVSSGQGGMVVTNDDGLHDRLREWKDQGRRHTGTGGDDLHPVPGFNFKYTNIQAAVALAQMDRLETRLAHFAQRNRWYKELLTDIDGLTFPPDEAGEITQWTDVRVSRRTEVIRALEGEGIGCRAFWLPLHRQEPYRCADDAFAGAIAASSCGLWLPSSFSLTRAQAERTAQVIRHSLRANR